MLSSDVNLSGRVRFVLTDEHGHLRADFEITNLVVTAGKNVIADRMKATPAKAAMTHMEVGTSGTAATLADTALAAAVALSRVTLTSTSVTANQITYVGTFPPGTGTGSLQEVGIFNASPAGDMLARATYSTLTKAVGDTLTVTWIVTVS